MITKDYLIKNGFKRDRRSPSSVEDWFWNEKPQGGYVSVRFEKGKENPCGLYAYTESFDHSNVRKVVLNDTTVTMEDLEMAKKICRF